MGIFAIKPNAVLNLKNKQKESKLFSLYNLKFASFKKCKLKF